MKSVALALAGGVALVFLPRGYERLHVALADSFHDWLPIGYLLFRETGLLGLPISVWLALSFAALCVLLFVRPSIGRPALTAALVTVSIELPLGMLYEAYRIHRRHLSIDFLSTAPSLPVGALLLLLIWRAWSAQRAKGDGRNGYVDVALAWLVAAYVATMAHPGVIAM